MSCVDSDMLWCGSYMNAAGWPNQPPPSIEFLFYIFGFYPDLLKFVLDIERDVY